MAKRWDVDDTAVRKACHTLNIRFPVKVRATNGTRKQGTHRFQNGKHVISVSGWLDFVAASHTLWHELCHAKQFTKFVHQQEEEADARGDAVMPDLATLRVMWQRMYADSCKTYGYKNAPEEVEARACADAYSHVLLMRYRYDPYDDFEDDEW